MISGLSETLTVPYTQSRAELCAAVAEKSGLSADAISIYMDIKNLVLEDLGSYDVQPVSTFCSLPTALVKQLARLWCPGASAIGSLPTACLSAQGMTLRVEDRGGGLGGAGSPAAASAEEPLTDLQKTLQHHMTLSFIRAVMRKQGPSLFATGGVSVVYAKVEELHGEPLPKGPEALLEWLDEYYCNINGDFQPLLSQGRMATEYGTAKNKKNPWGR